MDAIKCGLDAVAPTSVVSDHFDFLRDIDYMQATVADLTGYFDEETLRRAMTEQKAKSKIDMES